MNEKVYRVECRRYGSWWQVTVPQVEQASTHARRLDQVDARAREMLAGLLKMPEDSLRLDVQPQWEGDIATQLDELYAVMRAAERAADLKRSTAVMLAGKGFTLRDIATALGCTHQRVQQLIQEYHQRQHAKTTSKKGEAA